MGVKCEGGWGKGGIYITVLWGCYFKHGVAFVHATAPLGPLGQSVNGHLCVNNPTLVLFYHGCLLKVQHGGGSMKPKPAWVRRFISQYQVALVWRGGNCLWVRVPAELYSCSATKWLLPWRGCLHR